MQTILERCELVVASDIHLRGTNDERYTILCELIETMTALKPKNFVLLGDVFDFFFGMRHYYAKKYAGLGLALQKLADAGTQVYFYEGNHEFDLRATKWPNVNFVTEGDISISLNDGAIVRLNHGDLVYSSAAYRRFRRFVKSKFVKWIAFILPAWLLEAYALQHAKASRAQDPYRKLDHKSLFDCASSWLKKSGADIGIIGHFHVPYNEVIGSQRVVSVDSWDTINFLAFKDGKIYRGFYNQRWSVTTAPETDYQRSH